MLQLVLLIAKMHLFIYFYFFVNFCISPMLTHLSECNWSIYQSHY